MRFGSIGMMGTVQEFIPSTTFAPFVRAEVVEGHEGSFKVLELNHLINGYWG
jgi:hypothetical protein